MADFRIENGILKEYTGTGGDVIIPDGVMRIGGFAFEGCKNVRSVIIPDSITEIGEYAFYNCKTLQSVKIPDTVNAIGKNAFYGCQNLRNIVIPDSVNSIGNGAFDSCKRLQSITLPKEVKTIGDGMFYDCENLLTVTLPEGVTNIGSISFSGCKNLQNITIPDSVTSIGMNAFDKCNSLLKCVLAPGSADADQCKMILKAFKPEQLVVPFLSDNIETNAILRKNLQSMIIAKKFREKYIPDLIKKGEGGILAKLLSFIKKMPPEEIDGYIEKAENNAELRAVLLEYKKRLYPPEVLDQMEEIQMEKDFGLREKTLADYRKDFTITKNNDCYCITGYKGEDPNTTIPGNIKGIPVQFTEKVFKNNDCIQNVVIEEGVREIVDYAFRGCTNLQDITIPASVSAIGDKAFYGRQKYITVSAPEGSYAAEYAKKKKIKFQAI